MSQPPSSPGPAHPPDPGPDRPAPTTPPGIARLLELLVLLTRFGHFLFGSLLHPERARPDALLRHYGTAEAAVVLRYVLRGWLRVCALAEVLHRRARRGQDVGRPQGRKPGAGKPGAGRRGGRRTPGPAAGEIPLAERIPSEQELIAWVRRRPIETVLAAIARDFSLLPGMLSTAAWQAFEQQILLNAGEAAQPLLARLRKLRPLATPAPDSANPPPAAPALPPLKKLLHLAIHAAQSRPPGQRDRTRPVQEMLRSALQAITGPPPSRPAHA